MAEIAETAETGMAAGVLARSPIAPAPPQVVVAGWVVSGRRSDAALTLTDATPLAKVALRAGPDGPLAQRLAVPFGRARRRGLGPDAAIVASLVVGAGPGEWLALAAPDARPRLVDLLRAEAEAADELVSVVDATHGRALVRLTGARSADLLATECAVDLADHACPDGTALRTAVAGLSADVVRDDRAGERSYLLHCERSSGQYLFDSLLDAGTRFAVETDGFVPPGV